MSSNFNKLPPHVQERMKLLTARYATKKMVFDSTNLVNVSDLTLDQLIELANKQNIAAIEMSAAMVDIQNHHNVCLDMLSEIVDED